MNKPRRAGTAWERRVVDHANLRGFAWDRAPLRGDRDLLDVSGSLPDGWLVGCKAIGRGQQMGERINDAMRQADRALANLAPMDVRGIIPVQVMQRSGYPLGKAYVVMEYDRFLDLAELRKEWGK